MPIEQLRAEQRAAKEALLNAYDAIERGETVTVGPLERAYTEACERLARAELDADDAMGRVK
jgi:hypothetical protein